MEWLASLLETLLATLQDVLPIAAVIFGLQLLILRRPIPNLKRTLFGFFYVLLGLSLFLQGLEQALFPLGRLMAAQLTHPAFLEDEATGLLQTSHWVEYYWVYIFAFAIGFSTTVAEPSLIAVAIKANQVSGGAIGVWGLRIAVAIGVAVGISLGTWRIVTGYPLHYFIITGYVFVIFQTFYAPRIIVPLAYDSGGVTTSTVTVPLVAALGVGMASSLRDRNPMTDGFGLIAFASLSPMIFVMAYGSIVAWT